MDTIERIIEIIRGFPKLKDRVPPFKRPAEYQSTPEQGYDWLINIWMPTQPDFETLVELTVLLNFNVLLVVAALMGEETFERECTRLAK